MQNCLYIVYTVILKLIRSKCSFNYNKLAVDFTQLNQSKISFQYYNYYWWVLGNPTNYFKKQNLKTLKNIFFLLPKRYHAMNEISWNILYMHIIGGTRGVFCQRMLLLMIEPLG